MNTYGYHITNDSVAAAHAWVLPELKRAMNADASFPRLRTSVARSLMKAGEWLLRDRPQTATDSVHVLPSRSTARGVRKAA